MADERPAASDREPLPWWLDEGSERCPHCLHLHHYEQELRCAGCDGPLCAHCARRISVRHEVFCPDCFRPDRRPPGPAAEGRR